jgi:hypothetical protein
MVIVLVARSHRECNGQLRVCAAGGVDAVPEDEASSASADAGVWVAPPSCVVHGSAAVGRKVGAVHGHHLTDHAP